MKSMNKVQLIGYLGRDPEYHTSLNGHEMAYMRLATDYWYHPKEGEPQKYTDWHTVRLWRKDQVSKMKNYIIKGSHVLVEGRLSYRQTINKHGGFKLIAEIKASLLIDLDR